MSHLQLSLFDGHLERKRLFHIFHFQVLKGLSHESPFSHLQLSAVEGSFARNAFLRVADAQNAVLYKTKRARKMDGEALRAMGARRSRLYRGHGRIGLAVELTIQACSASLLSPRF